MNNSTIKVSSVIPYFIIVGLLYGFWSYQQHRLERIYHIRAQTLSLLAPWVGRELLERHQWQNGRFVSLLNANVRDLWNASDYPVESITIEGSSIHIYRKSKLDSVGVEFEFRIIRDEKGYILEVNIPQNFLSRPSVFTKALVPCDQASSACFMLDPPTAYEWANQP